MVARRRCAERVGAKSGNFRGFFTGPDPSDALALFSTVLAKATIGINVALGRGHGTTLAKVAEEGEVARIIGFIGVDDQKVRIPTNQGIIEPIVDDPRCFIARCVCAGQEATGKDGWNGRTLVLQVDGRIKIRTHDGETCIAVSRGLKGVDHFGAGSAAAIGPQNCPSTHITASDHIADLQWDSARDTCLDPHRFPDPRDPDSGHTLAREDQRTNHLPDMDSLRHKFAPAPHSDCSDMSLHPRSRYRPDTLHRGFRTESAPPHNQHLLHIVDRLPPEH